MDIDMIFSLYRDKENIEDRDADDTVEYSLRQTWHFNPEKSDVGECGDLHVSSPHDSNNPDYTKR